ncbi:MAG: hypothetical protein HY835_02690 [Anaerolineae bacterium]|nr:hypothetical protein [Anaerolineae bacterium]
MSENPRLQFGWEDWERVERDTMAWWEGELDRPLVYLNVEDPAVPSAHHFMSNYPLEMPAEEVVDRYARVLESTRYFADAFPWLWVNFGPGIVAGFLGSNVNSVVEPSETVWFTPRQKPPIHQLDLAYDAQNVWWLRVKELTEAFGKRYDGMLQVSHTDLGGNLDIIASFRDTQDLLMDTLDEPEQVDRLVNQVTGLWKRYYTELHQVIKPYSRGTSSWAPIWSNQTTYMLQCDFSYMISPAMFERFVVPDLTACCAMLEHGFYHLDGKGQIPHLDLLLGIERLRGIQWIPGDGQPTPEHWLPLLKRIRDGGKRCQLYLRPEGAHRIVKELGGKGFLFVINLWDRVYTNPDEVSGFLKTLAQDDISLK